MDTEMDHGPIILQAAVKVYPDDDRDALTTRILEAEHQILPRTIQLFAQRRLLIEDRKVIILPGDSWIKKHKVLSDVLYSEGY
jgi:phosphoribosylglycinamide formyltransferase-1